MNTPVRVLQRQIGAAEFAEWMAFDKIEPGYPLREDVHAGIIASTIVNANPYRKKGSKTAEIRDFILDWLPKKKPKTSKELKIKMQQWLSMRRKSREKKDK